MHPAQHQAQVPDSFISVKEFARRSTLSRAEIYNRISAGELPRPWRLSKNRVAWPMSVWEGWVATMAAQNVGRAA